MGQTTQPSVRVDSMACRISIDPQLTTAHHEYEYTLTGVGDEASTEFSFFIPNATQEMLQRVTAEEESYDGSIDRGIPQIHVRDETDGHGSTIVFRYRRPLSKGTQRRLRFGYGAPTSAQFYKGPVSEVVFYQAHFFHLMPIDRLDLTLCLPLRSRVKNVEPLASRAGTILTFKAENVPFGHRRFFSVFFVRRLRFRTAVLSVATLATGAGLHALGSGAAATVGQWILAGWRLVARP